MRVEFADGPLHRATPPLIAGMARARTGGGDGGDNGYMAATLSGTLNVPGTELISFSIGADDRAFAFLDGVNVCDLGEVHGDTVGSCGTPFNITAGSHNLQVPLAGSGPAFGL